MTFVSTIVEYNEMGDGAQYAIVTETWNADGSVTLTIEGDEI